MVCLPALGLADQSAYAFQYIVYDMLEPSPEEPNELPDFANPTAINTHTITYWCWDVCAFLDVDPESQAPESITIGFDLESGMDKVTLFLGVFLKPDYYEDYTQDRDGVGGIMTRHGAFVAHKLIDGLAEKGGDSYRYDDDKYFYEMEFYSNEEPTFSGPQYYITAERKMDRIRPHYR